MEGKALLLSEDDLDGIVGGAFNQKTVDRLGLDVTTGRGGAQGLTVDVQASCTKDPSMIDTRTDNNNLVSEKSLRSIVGHYDQLSVSAKNTSGGMVKLSQSDLNELLS